jgi:RNA polymerase sigma factor (sigma-70 family)
LEIIEWINDFKPLKPFSHFLNQCLEGNKWIPKFMNADFIKDLNTESIYQENEEGNEEDVTEKIANPEKIKIEFKYKLTGREQEIWDLASGNLHLSQEKIAEELGISQMTVSRAIASIKEKIQK